MRRNYFKQLQVSKIHSKCVGNEFNCVFFVNNRFKENYQLHFGKEIMRSTMHLILHLVDSIIEHGSMHCRSGYPGESYNGRMIGKTTSLRKMYYV